MSKQPEWWHEFFKSFQPVFAYVPPKSHRELTRYVIKKMNLKPGMSFLDCPCGPGRIALPLAKKGIRVTGVDIMPEYLEEAALKAKRRKLKLDLVHSDMRRIDYHNKFDAVGNIWTSFGYFEGEKANRLVLKKLYEAVKPGGKVFLHLINRDWTVVNFEEKGWIEISGMKVLQDRKFDYSTSTSRDTWTFVKDGTEVAHDIHLRLYSYHELVALFKSVGFVNIEGFGSIKDEPIDHHKRMMYVFGTKPKG